MRDSTVKRLSSWHRFLYRVSAGRIGSRLAGNDMVLLTTTGRTTGRGHTVPLLRLRDGENSILVASYGGRARHPEWYLNLTARPDVTVQFRGEIRPMRARTATPGERELWWPRAVAAYPDYAAYQSRTEREIPLVILEQASQS